MEIVTRIALADEAGEEFFGEPLCALLRAVEAHGSLRAAALSLHMSYSRAFHLIRQAERALGFPLTARTTGGRSGGGSVLTPEGRARLERFEAYLAACVRANRALCRQYFPPEGPLFPDAGCVIMASGLGKRFGGNKLMAELGGKPMLRWALDAAEGLFGRLIVITRHEDAAALCRARGVEVLLHELPDRSDTIRLGLGAMGEDIGRCMFLPGDQPLLRRESIAAMLSASRENDAVWRAVCGAEKGSPVIFPRSLFPELLALEGKQGGRVVVKNHPELVREYPLDDPDELRDVDTVEEMERVRGMVEGGSAEPSPGIS